MCLSSPPSPPPFLPSPPTPRESLANSRAPNPTLLGSGKVLPSNFSNSNNKQKREGKKKKSSEKSENQEGLPLPSRKPRGRGAKGSDLPPRTSEHPFVPSVSPSRRDPKAALRVFHSSLSRKRDPLFECQLFSPPPPQKKIYIYKYISLFIFNYFFKALDCVSRAGGGEPGASLESCCCMKGNPLFPSPGRLDR